MDNTPTKTAIMELIEKYKTLPKSSNEWTNGLIRSFIKDATELLEKEKTQIVDAFQSGYSNGNIDTGMIPDQYYNKTYKQ